MAFVKASVNHSAETNYLPILSSQNRGWENILVNQFQPPPGEALCHFSQEHAICLSLAAHPVRSLHIKGGKTQTGLYRKGDLSITPAQVPLFARWEDADHFLEIRIASHFIERVATETLAKNPGQLELLPEFRMRDPHLEAIALMLLTELQQENPGSRLYIESLTNLLAVHLLRQYATSRPQVSVYRGGLPQRQLVQVLDYINDHLDQEIKLADLAALVGISQFHFCHLFKQAIATTPYQYLLQQRIERAKHLLKQTNHSIMEIALMCGFSSHSHLSQQFRQATGMTPKAYRMN
ncbi:AraC family transcriptional regulator [Kovacikia minuta CCNUW1]|uniref:helix-turn-helix domain-containing protein n=1 Tax=Kovacikia minuta TaxID=2931930 RepID=UPI001CCFB2C4|nr:AraC family transcriptional regulator [Kovacikia minuta]UBF29170.1 AraC family transcriptional regulator [Kovacikia minuta CCNUW1]